ncbi:MAG: T9SS type A sorting domain-containing protein [Flavobacteriales bacterium]|nr:T9SS type A sorting domain-containing protein [Flavobacteriales bacterium]
MRSLVGQGVLKHIFPNILLPDSNVNEAASHGFASFRIRPHVPLLPGTVIENTANIFFDYNEPVITEPSILVAEFSTEVGGEDANALFIAPNPATTEVRITAGHEVIARVTLFAADGRMMMNTVPNTTATTLNFGTLPSGLYIVQVDLASGTTSRKRLLKH